MRHTVSNTHISAIALTLLVTTCGWSVVVSDATDSDQLPADGAQVFWGVPPAHLQSIHVGPDQETLNYLIPRLTAKFRPNDDWMGVNNDPRFYVLSEFGRQDNLNQQEQENLLASNDNDKMQKRDGKLGRNGPSLSIVQPLDILRQRMLLEIARRKALQQVKQVQANREILENLGKRNLGGLATGTHTRQSTQSRNALQYDTL
ncbi:uncharacterized protein LOC123290519 [Chrysoperla carnea]|uniref:uncharacterized protein LOC123290519 n=1 Tax=Chrysoperla carnea TaxID=189513 RepID=UPI001D075FE5|nr:uncharacterized protein LOC123290519 [Chrysoperla carnea]XP_044726676.1 uncharacterized protein LOC123290519 [Chrysoperla carnea]